MPNHSVSMYECIYAHACFYVGLNINATDSFRSHKHKEYHCYAAQSRSVIRQRG